MTRLDFGNLFSIRTVALRSNKWERFTGAAKRASFTAGQTSSQVGLSKKLQVPWPTHAYIELQQSSMVHQRLHVIHMPPPHPLNSRDYKATIKYISSKFWTEVTLK